MIGTIDIGKLYLISNLYHINATKKFAGSFSYIN